MAVKSAVPNQKTVIIKKTPCTKNFLQIQNDEWQEAAKLCKASSSFKLYLYLAANAENYRWLLSKTAVEKALGFQKTTYYSSIKELKDLGYLRDIGNNTYEFYTKNPNSATTENSAGAEKVDNDLNSGLAENSAVPEKLGDDLNSATAEKFATAENENFIFDF